MARLPPCHVATESGPSWIFTTIEILFGASVGPHVSDNCRWRLVQKHASVPFSRVFPASLLALIVPSWVRVDIVAQMIPVWGLWSEPLREVSAFWQPVYRRHAYNEMRFCYRRAGMCPELRLTDSPGPGVGGHWGVDFGSVPVTPSYNFRVGFPIAGLSPEAQAAKSHTELVCVFPQGSGLFISL